MNSLFPPVHACLMQTDPESKLQQAHALWQLWQQGQLDCNPDGQPPPEAIPVPGRPRRPELVHPRQVRQRKLTTAAGRIALLHAVAHIEFNAINLALDAAYRFRGLPPDYYGNWLQVAAEEARHFRLVRQRLQALGADYGDLPAHNGLWEQACK
nr:ferritin-like domain-containing protein [Thiolinea sp.]